jgi:hypothetical protein
LRAEGYGAYGYMDLRGRKYFEGEWRKLTASSSTVLSTESEETTKTEADWAFRSHEEVNRHTEFYS